MALTSSFLQKQDQYIIDNSYLPEIKPYVGFTTRRTGTVELSDLIKALDTALTALEAAEMPTTTEPINKARVVKAEVAKVNEAITNVQDKVTAIRSDADAMDAKVQALEAEALAETDTERKDAKELEAQTLRAKAQEDRNKATDAEVKAQDALEKATKAATEANRAGQVAVEAILSEFNTKKTTLESTEQELDKVKNTRAKTLEDLENKVKSVAGLVLVASAAINAMSDTITNYKSQIELAQQTGLTATGVQTLVDTESQIETMRTKVDEASKATKATYYAEMDEQDKIAVLSVLSHSDEADKLLEEICPEGSGITAESELESMTIYAISKDDSKLEELLTINENLSIKKLATPNVVSDKSAELIHKETESSQDPERLHVLMTLKTKHSLDVDTEALAVIITEKVKEALKAYEKEYSTNKIFRADSKLLQNWQKVAKAGEILDVLTANIEEWMKDPKEHRDTNLHAIFRGTQDAGLIVTKPLLSVSSNLKPYATPYRSGYSFLELAQGRYPKEFRRDLPHVILLCDAPTFKQIMDESRGHIEKGYGYYNKEVIEYAQALLQDSLRVATNMVLMVVGHAIKHEFKKLKAVTTQTQKNQRQLDASKATSEQMLSMAEAFINEAGQLKTTDISYKAAAVMESMVQAAEAIKSAVASNNANAIKSSVDEFNQFIDAITLKKPLGTEIAQEIEEKLTCVTTLANAGSIALKTTEALRIVTMAAQAVEDKGVYANAIALLGGDSGAITAQSGSGDTSTNAADKPITEAEAAEKKVQEAEEAEAARKKAQEAEKAEAARKKAQEAEKAEAAKQAQGATPVASGASDGAPKQAIQTAKKVKTKTRTPQQRATNELNAAQTTLEEAEQALSEAMNKLSKTPAAADSLESALITTKALQKEVNTAADSVTAAADKFATAVQNANQHKIAISEAQKQAAQQAKWKANKYKQDLTTAVREASQALEKQNKAELSTVTQQVDAEITDASTKLAQTKEAFNKMPQGAEKDQAASYIKTAEEELKKLTDQKSASTNDLSSMKTLSTSMSLAVFSLAIANVDTAIALSNTKQEAAQGSVEQAPAAPLNQAPTTPHTTVATGPGTSSACDVKKSLLTPAFKDHAWDALHYYEVNIRAQVLEKEFSNITITQGQWTQKGDEFEEFTIQTLDIIPGKTPQCQDRPENMKKQPMLCCLGKVYDNGIAPVKSFVAKLLAPAEAEYFKGLNNIQAHSKYAYCQAIAELKENTGYDKPCFQAAFTDICSDKDLVGDVCKAQTTNFWAEVDAFVCAK